MQTPPPVRFDTRTSDQPLPILLSLFVLPITVTYFFAYTVRGGRNAHSPVSYRLHHLLAASSQPHGCRSLARRALHASQRQ